MFSVVAITLVGVFCLKIDPGLHCYKKRKYANSSISIMILYIVCLYITNVYCHSSFMFMGSRMFGKLLKEQVVNAMNFFLQLSLSVTRPKSMYKRDRYQRHSSSMTRGP